MPYKKPPVKLAIVDDHNLFRKGLITLINLADKREEYLVVFEAENGQDMMKKLDKKAIPDIILLDIDMPDMNGYEAIAWLQKHYPQVAVLVVSMVEKEESVVRMVRLGAKGYLSKDIEVDDIHGALKALSQKQYYYSDFLTGKLIDSILRGTEGDDSVGAGNKIWRELSEREREFIKFSCMELTYEEIAGNMFVSPKTVDGYRSSLFAKFGVKTRVGLVVFAIKNGLVSIAPDSSQ